MTITSSHNQKLKEIRKLQMRRRERERARRFVAEGEDLLEAADAAGWEAIERFCTAGSGLRGVEVEPRLLASASGLGSGTRTLGVYEQRWAPTPIGPLCVYLHGVHDPGNVGAVLRSAAAFGASCVAIGPTTADPFGPKAVRASMGAVFAVPLWRASLRRRFARPAPRHKNRTGLQRRSAAGRGLPPEAERDHAADRRRARGPPGGRDRRRRSHRPHPDSHPLAERRDGSRRRALRGDEMNSRMAPAR